MSEILAVSRERGEVFADDGQYIPITNWFDSDAEECVPEDARACVAGPDRDGGWWTISLDDFGDVARH